VPQPVVTERHPAGYRWAERLPGAAVVLRREGGGVYAAEDGRALWLIRDESGLASLLADDDQVDAVSLSRYSDRERWVADVVELRNRHARAINQGETKTWPGPHDGPLSDLVDGTAHELGRLTAERGLSAINEQAHLQPVCAAMARRLANHWADHPAVIMQLRVAFAAWPVGDVDLAIGNGDAPALLELKCGTGRDATGQCVWDALKLAFAVQCNKGIGFLLAGAPTSDWAVPRRGTEFFADGPHEAALLRVLYADWWRHWERRSDPQPTELPDSFWTEHVHSAAFDVADTPWQLRLAQVFVTSEQRIPWPRFTDLGT
jgi:hypothetical protein